MVTVVTHTYTLLGLSEDAYEEIKGKLLAAGYDHVFITNATGLEVIDMGNIGLALDSNDKNTAPPAVGSLFKQVDAYTPPDCVLVDCVHVNTCNGTDRMCVNSDPNGTPSIVDAQDIIEHSQSEEIGSALGEGRGKITIYTYTCSFKVYVPGIHKRIEIYLGSKHWQTLDVPDSRLVDVIDLDLTPYGNRLPDVSVKGVNKD